MVQLLDNFGVPHSIIFITSCELIAVAWFYGYGRFADDVTAMLRRRPGPHWKLIWAFIAPVVLPVRAHSPVTPYYPVLRVRD